MSHQQRAQRETAIAAAEGMLRDLEDRLPDASHRACSEFKDALAKLQEWDDAVREKQSSLRFPHDAIRQARQIAAFRQASLRLESDLDAFVSALQQVEDWVVLAAERARQASEAAAKGTQVDSREEGRAALQETLQHVAGVRDAAARAEASLDVVAEAADAFLQNLRSLAAWPRQRVQDAQSALHQIQEARNALKQREELEVEWRQRYRRLSSAVARMQSIHAEFERGSQRIQAELASHPPNEPIDAVHQRLHQLRSKLECLENNFHIWASPTGSGWVGRKFPELVMPPSEELRDARLILTEFARLAQLPSLEEFENRARVFQRVRRELENELNAAKLRADLCLSRAIVDFDRRWRAGDLTRVAEEEAGIPVGDPSEDAATVEPEPSRTTTDDPPDAGLSEAEDATSPVPSDYVRKPDSLFVLGLSGWRTILA